MTIVFNKRLPYRSLTEFFTLTIKGNPKNKKTYSVEFIFLKQNFTPLQGIKAEEAMRLVKINECQMEQVSMVSITLFSNVFEGLGTLQCQVSSKLDESVQPLISPSHRIPVALQPKVKGKLDILVGNGVIVPIIPKL
ncbi:unnamed protein product [Lepeophtheirus salmonis]|uniref:(salmon louse) hypothetical protein n=1 Tax=Lepeophtheirus salmonis TaxID=72036 RepID=A0A7R8D2F8_LEPSM|nr:unnamed protein product [Lepeophtheirus salmonis]CAF3004412.1 unnamed protein product [Lepeophtheirus salmonis]